MNVKLLIEDIYESKEGRWEVALLLRTQYYPRNWT